MESLKGTGYSKIVEQLEERKYNNNNICNKWYFDDKLKQMATDILDAVMNGNIDAFKEAFSKYSDHLRVYSYDKGAEDTAREYEESF